MGREELEIFCIVREEGSFCIIHLRFTSSPPSSAAIETSPYPPQAVHWNYVDCVRWLGAFLISKSVDNQITMWQPDEESEESKNAGHVRLIQEFQVSDWFCMFFLGGGARCVCGGVDGLKGGRGKKEGGTSSSCRRISMCLCCVALRGLPGLPAAGGLQGRMVGSIFSGLLGVCTGYGHHQRPRAGVRRARFAAAGTCQA
jgi:hypothetical protein